MISKDAVTRATWVKNYMDKCGMTYVQACKAFDCMVSTLEDAICNGQKVHLGKVGNITPVWRPPRTVVMGCKRLPGNKFEKVRQEYILGGRIHFKFNLHRQFSATRQLHWHE